MDETATRRKKIDPKLYGVGWEQVPESEILTEQRAYQIAPGPNVFYRTVSTSDGV